MRELQDRFGQIYNDCVEKVYRFIFIKVNSKELAEDLTAETFVKAWGVFKKAKNQNSLQNPQAFCYRIARNLVIDHYRSKAKATSVPLDFPVADPKVRIEEAAMINSDMEMVMKGMTALKDDYQDVIIWRYLDELSIEEIALLLDKTEDATRVMIHRAMASLKNVLES